MFDLTWRFFILIVLLPWCDIMLHIAFLMWIVNVKKVRMLSQFNRWQFLLLLSYEFFGLEILLFNLSSSPIQHLFLLFFLNFGTEINHLLG